MKYATTRYDPGRCDASVSSRQVDFLVSPDDEKVRPDAQEIETVTSLPQEDGPARNVTLGELRLLPRAVAELVPQDRFESLQQWECTIESITGDTVTASLRDLTDRTQPDEIVDLPLDEFSPADVELVTSGAVFYWTIGYRITPTGTKERVSRFRMRRVPLPTRRQLECISREAAALAAMFGLQHPGEAR